MAVSALRNSASLATQLTRRLLLIGSCFMIGLLLLVGLVVHGRFAVLESREIAAHFTRTESLLADIRKNVQARSLDWAVWDDSYDFLENGNAAFATANLGYTSIFNLNANGLAYVRFDGRFSEARYADNLTEGLNPAKASQFLAFARHQALAKKARHKAVFQTFMRQGEQVLAISVAQVLHSDGSGASPGYIVIGREISEAEVSSALALPARFVLDETARKHSTQSTWSANTMRIPFAGLDGVPVATIEFTAPRSLAREGRLILLLTAIGAVLTGYAMIATLARAVRSLVIGPIETFQAHVAAISESGELTHVEAAHRSDEIGLLHAEFNTMIDELGTLRAKVERQSYIIGKRDSAVSVMHNIGNGIGPVKTIMSRLEAILVPPARQDVNRALDELGADHPADSRTTRLVDFLRAAFAMGAAAALEQRELVRTALRSVDLVEGIIINQMEESRNDPIRDTAVKVGPILTNAVQLARQRSPHLTIDLKTDNRLAVRANSVMLAQVVENLLKNADEAIAANGADKGHVEVAVVTAMQGKLPVLQISIIDNGDGFDPAKSEQLFEKGISSRGKQVGGLGLHWCATTIGAMGGRISLESKGQGYGARAIIELPLAEDSPTSPALAA